MIEQSKLVNPLAGSVKVLRELNLSEMSRIAKHVNVEQLGYVATSPRGVLLTERVSYDGALLVDDGALFGGRASRSDLSDEIA